MSTILKISELMARLFSNRVTSNRLITSDVSATENFWPCFEMFRYNVTINFLVELKFKRSYFCWFSFTNFKCYDVMCGYKHIPFVIFIDTDYNLMLSYCLVNSSTL